MEKKGRRRILTIVGSLLAAPIAVVLLVILLLYVPSIQRYVVGRIGASVENSTGYNLTMGEFRLHFPLNVAISDFVLSQNGDTLLDGEKLRLNVSALPLLRGEIEVNYISIDNTAVDSYHLIKGLRIDGNIGYFRTAIRNIDPLDERISINQLNLTDSRLRLTKLPYVAEKDTMESAPAEWIISLNKGRVAGVDLIMENPNDTAAVIAYLGSAKLQDAVIDLENGRYTLQKAEFADCEAGYDSGNLPDSIAPLRHLRFGDIAIVLSALEYSRKNISAKLDSLKIRQIPTGITIDDAAFEIVGDTSNVVLKKLKVNTLNGSRLSVEASLPIELLEGLQGNGNAHAEVELELDKRDLQGFIPANKYSAMVGLPDSLLRFFALGFH